MSRSIIGGITTLVMCGIVGVLCWHFLGRPESIEESGESLQTAGKNAKDKFDSLNISSFGDFADVLTDGLEGLNFGDYMDSDPRVGDNSTLLWKKYDPQNGGLSLTLRNALDENWQEEFKLAVADWQESDALVLTPQQVDVDYSCTPVEGTMVVCNGNFGDTGWVGINENSVQGGRIIQSVAKMNEYYLRNAEFAHRRYTMCHEIGHGFGLPHTDENPYNSNQGNCLDYTDDPEDNLLPGDVNMNKLRGMYLTERRERKAEEDESMNGEEEIVIQTTVLRIRGHGGKK